MRNIFYIIMGLLFLSCLGFIIYTVYNCFHVENNENAVRDSVVVTHVTVKDTIVIKEIRSSRPKVLKKKKSGGVYYKSCTCNPLDTCW